MQPWKGRQAVPPSAVREAAFGFSAAVPLRWEEPACVSGPADSGQGDSSPPLLSVPEVFRFSAGSAGGLTGNHQRGFSGSGPRGFRISFAPIPLKRKSFSQQVDSDPKSPAGFVFPMLQDENQVARRRWDDRNPARVLPKFPHKADAGILSGILRQKYDWKSSGQGTVKFLLRGEIAADFPLESSVSSS